MSFELTPCLDPENLPPEYMSIVEQFLQLTDQEDIVVDLLLQAKERTMSLFMCRSRQESLHALLFGQWEGGNFLPVYVMPQDCRSDVAVKLLKEATE